jgi:hypothetical protein
VLNTVPLEGGRAVRARYAVDHRWHDVDAAARRQRAGRTKLTWLEYGLELQVLAFMRIPWQSADSGIAAAASSQAAVAIYALALLPLPARGVKVLVRMSCSISRRSSSTRPRTGRNARSFPLAINRRIDSGDKLE